MTSLPPLPPQDPLVALWQTAPQPDTHHLVEDVKRQNRLHRRLNRSVLAILYGLALLFIFEEATGRLESHGLLSVIWIVFVTGVVWRRRAQCNRFDAVTLDTVSLLKSMIARAKSDLVMARRLYAGVPLSAATSYFVLKLAGIGPSPAARAVSPHLQMLQTAAGVSALIIMTATGAILARARHHQVQYLSEKLKSIQADL